MAAGGKSTSASSKLKAKLRGRAHLIGSLVAAALVAVAVVLAFVGAGQDADPGPEAIPPRVVSRDALASLAASLGHPIYWAGEQAPNRLELSSEADGSVYVRYLPPATTPGSRPAAFLTVGSYPVADAAAALRRAARAAGSTVELVDGALVFSDPGAPRSVYLARPGSDLQVEVYDPVPRRAMALVRSGIVRPVRAG